MTTTTTTTTPTIDTSIPSIERIQKVEEGLKFITSHFDPKEPLCSSCPRTVSTHATGGKQVEVKSFEEAMSWFKAAKFLDCRISAYPVGTSDYIASIDSIVFISSLLVLCDLDKEHFRTAEEFEATAKKILLNFRNILGSTPTQLWTGSGYHFLQPQSVIALEGIEDFNQFKESPWNGVVQPVSRKFLQFEEWLMTDGKANQEHNRSVSFRNCMLRIPGTIQRSVST